MDQCSRGRNPRRRSSTARRFRSEGTEAPANDVCERHSILRARLRSRPVISVSKLRTSATIFVALSMRLQRYFVAETLLSLRLSLDKNSFVHCCSFATAATGIWSSSASLVIKHCWGAKMMIDFEGWDVGYADARNGQPSQCPTNVDPISYLSGYCEGCSPDRAHTSLSVQMKRGWIR